MYQFCPCVLFSAARSLPKLYVLHSAYYNRIYRLKLRCKNTGSYMYMYKHKLDITAWGFTGLETSMMPGRQRKVREMQQVETDIQVRYLSAPEAKRRLVNDPVTTQHDRNPHVEKLLSQLLLFSCTSRGVCILRIL